MAKWVLTVGAVLAWIFGLILLFNARAFEAPVGIDVTDKVATIAQAQVAILLGLGVTNWLARDLTDPGALTAVLGGNLVVQLVSLSVAARALMLHIFPRQGAPAIVIHVVLAGLFAAALLQVRRRGLSASVRRLPNVALKLTRRRY